LFYETKKYFGHFGITIGCPYCHGRSKKHGWFRGRRRYRCLSCHRTFERQKHLPVSWTDFVAFYRLVTGWMNRKQIEANKHLSRATLSIRFRPFFNRPLSAQETWGVLPPRLSASWVYGVDGKWLKRLGVFLLHRNVTTGENLYWSFQPSESYLAVLLDLTQLVELLTNQLGERNILPLAAISDWKGAIVAAVAAVFGDIPHQRCLTHVTRTLKLLLPEASPLEATLDLRGIALRLIGITNTDEVADWFTRLTNWYNRWGYLLKVRTKNTDPVTKRKWWYTHGNLRRAWRQLTHDPKPFFHHLSCLLLPHSNNSLEGTISQATNKLNDHRGMKLDQQVAFLNWHFTFTRVKTNQDLRKLWAYWRSRKNRRLATHFFT